MKDGHRWLLGALVVVAVAVPLALIVIGGQGSLAQGDTIYVDADATSAEPDGTSWETAYTTLQPALDEAEAGDEIWVAAGAYKPTRESDPGEPRSTTFQMVNGVAIYGGFDPSGGATAWEDRDWVNHKTILSGDLAGDDVPPFGHNEENSYHVFYNPASTNLDGSAILDGFTITSGNANGADPHYFGGGMLNDGSSPALNNCTFSGNSATIGGGMHNNDGSPTLTGCTFSGSSASSGGGLSNWSSSPSLTNCTFAHNSADYGGGMANAYSSAPTLNDCTFAHNSALWYGGGMRNASSSPVLRDVTFTDNSANQFGGGMFNDDGSSPTLTNCTFSDNSIPGYGSGGGISNIGSSPVLTNCTFAHNLAYHGGGMANSDSAPTLTNCILWGDSPEEVYSSDSTPSITYSDIQGGHSGTGNINEDPLFVNAANGDYHLGSGSPCIDAGTNDAQDLPSYDFEGDPRIMDGDLNGTRIVDMGVDEFGHAIYLPLVLRSP